MRVHLRYPGARPDATLCGEWDRGFATVTTEDPTAVTCRDCLGIMGREAAIR